MKSNLKDIKIFIEDNVMLNDTIWFCAYDFNALFSMDVVTKEIKVCGIFPGQPYHQHRLFSVMKLVGNKIYFIPCEASNIAVYDIDMKTIKIIDWPEEVKVKNEHISIICAQQYREYIYMLPSHGYCIIELDTSSGEITCIDGWKEKCENYIFCEPEMCFNKQSIIVDGNLYVPFYNANAVLKLNCDTMQVSVIKLGEEKRGYSGICYDGTHMWLSPNNTTKLVKWHEKNETVEENAIATSDEVKGFHPYAGLLSYKDNIICAPAIFRDDLSEIDDKFVILKGEYSYLNEDENNIYSYEGNSGVLTIMSKKSGNELKFNLRVNIDLIDGKGIVQGGRMENGRIGLKQFLEITVHSD